MDRVNEYLFDWPETESYNGIFEEAEIEGSNFIVLIGPLFPTIVFYSSYMAL